MKVKRWALGLFILILSMASVSCNSTVHNDNDISDNDISDNDIITTDVSINENDDNMDASENEIVDFTMFVAMSGTEIDDNNDICEEIAKRTGVRLKETWSTNIPIEEAVSKIIESGDIPDFIDGLDAMNQLYEQGLLVPWDEYLEKYPNLKELYTDEEWESFRKDDGHIYWANVFCNTYGEDKTKIHNDEAFWIQVRVLEYFDYPKITTLDEYFEILEKYYEENKIFTDSEGTVVDIIPYTALCDDWRYFCIENAPNFLDGYMMDGTLSVDTTHFEKPTAISYDNSETARRYLSKLNEEYKKGIVDKDFDLQTYDEYIEKLSTGAVLGMCDQFWDFDYSIDASYKKRGLEELGCDYVPLGLTIDKDMTQRWHVYGDYINNSSGIAVTTECSDPELAFSFLNAVLDQEIHDLRFWGIEGVDYLVDEDGLYYRTDEMRQRCNDEAYQKSHFCRYSYLPQWLGTSRDNINAMQPSEQNSEYYETVSKPLADCFKAYGAGGYVDMLGSEKEDIPVWYPLYTYSSLMTTDTPGAKAHIKMVDCKHEWLPKVVKANDFESAWKKYMAAYDACNPQDYIDEQQYELDYRINRR